MPSSPGYVRDLPREYETAKKRGDAGTGHDSKTATRERDRRKALKLGMVKPNQDLDHAQALSHGGSSEPSNFRAESPHVNRSFPRDSHGAMLANHPKARVHPAG